MKKISAIVPAHNEEKYIARCICSIKAAAKYYGGDVEIIVVCNRCTNRTAVIAKVRNSGITVADGDIIVTIDSDNRMTKGTLKEIAHLLSTCKYIGGGASIRFERYSFPLYLNDLLSECLSLSQDCTAVSFGLKNLLFRQLADLWKRKLWKMLQLPKH